MKTNTTTTTTMRIEKTEKKTEKKTETEEAGVMKWGVEIDRIVRMDEAIGEGSVGAL